MLLHNAYRSTQPKLPTGPSATPQSGPAPSPPQQNPPQPKADPYEPYREQGRRDWAALNNDYPGLLKYLGHDALVNVASGIDTAASLPRYIIQNGWDKGMDKAADHLAAFQAQYGPGEPSNAVLNAYGYGNKWFPGIDQIKREAETVPEVRGLEQLADTYGHTVDDLAAEAGKVDPRLSGAVGAIGHGAPVLVNPETPAMLGRVGSLLGKYADKATEGLSSLRAAPKPSPSVTDPFPLDSPLKFTPSDEGRVHLNSTPSALEREGEAARRSAAPAFTKSTVPTSEVDLSGLAPPSFSPPDNAISVVAHDPETGQLVGHSTFVPRGGAFQSLRMDVDPAYRGIGVGPSLLQDAVSHAHGQGMDFLSDSQVSIPAARTYEKLKGVNLQRNPDVDHIMDETDGQVGRSQNGQPVYSIPAASHADEALEGEPEPNSWIASQAYAEGGEVAPLLGGLGKLADRYAARLNPQAEHLAERAAETPSLTYNPTTGDLPHEGYLVPQPGRSTALDTDATPDDFHDFMLQHQDAFENPKAVIHAEKDPNGNGSFLHVAIHEPDFEGSMAAAQSFGAPGVREIHTGKNFSTSPETARDLVIQGKADAY
jgi:GNAT superfamily N-acetyltransferase